MSAQGSAKFPWPAHDDAGEMCVAPGASERLRARVAEILAENDALQLAFSTPRPFMIVTPLGMPARVRLRTALAAIGAQTRYRATVPDWAAAATPLYVRSLDEEDLARGTAYELAWRSRFEPRAEVWAFGGLPDYERLLAVKYSIRERFRSIRRHVGLGGRGTLRIQLHPFHVPDPLRLPIEDWWVRRMSLPEG